MTNNIKKIFILRASVVSMIKAQQVDQCTQVLKNCIDVKRNLKAAIGAGLSAEDLLIITIPDMYKPRHIVLTLECLQRNGSVEEKRLALQISKKLIELLMAHAKSDLDSTKRAGCENAIYKLLLCELFPDSGAGEIKARRAIDEFVRFNWSQEKALSWPERINDVGIVMLKVTLLVMAESLWFSKDISMQDKIVGTFSLIVSQIGVLMLERFSEKVFRGRHSTDAAEVNIRYGLGVL